MTSLVDMFLKVMLFASWVAGQTSYDYCNLLGEVISICEASTPGYVNLPASAQAICACGTALGTIEWGPSSYAYLASACASQYATIDVTIAQDAQYLEGLCTMYAGQAPSSAASTSVTRTTSLAATTTKATPGLITSLSNPTTIIRTVTATPTSSAQSSNNAAPGAKAEKGSLVRLVLPLLGMFLG